MKKNIYIIAGLGIIIIIGGWLLFTNVFSQPKIEENNIVQETIKKEATIVIDYGEGDLNSFDIKFEEGATAFDLLKNKTEELNITLETKSYDIGVMIEKIGDKKNGQDQKYWLYYVNGEAPMVSADKLEMKAGDKVEFKFEKSIF
jgi:hypothetical protein